MSFDCCETKTYHHSNLKQQPQFCPDIATRTHPRADPSAAGPNSSMGSHHVAAVDGFGQLLAEMLTTAAHVKEKTTTVDQPLNKSDLGGLFSKIDTVFTSTSSPEVKKRAQYAIIETAVFEVFSDLLVRLPMSARQVAILLTSLGNNRYRYSIVQYSLESS